MARDYAAIIAALLANAENEATPEAARQAYRDKAESMMREYRIAEEDALATDPGSILPVSKTLSVVRMYDIYSREWFPMILRTIAKHCEVEIHIQHVWLEERQAIIPTVVGYEGDIRYFEFLWTASHLMFSTRISPTWDSSRPEEDNIFFMRQAGIERREIANAAWGRDAGRDSKNRSKVQRIYLSQAKKRGEVPTATGLGFQTKLYRESYAESFWSTLDSRLRRARHAANAAGGVVTLANRAERVLEAFYVAFPQYRPDDTPTVYGPYVAPNADCDRCKKAASGYCRGHGYLKPRKSTKADRNRWDREANSASAAAGRVSGRTAAEGVQIQRGTRETGKVDPATTRQLS